MTKDTLELLKDLLSAQQISAVDVSLMQRVIKAHEEIDKALAD